MTAEIINYAFGALVSIDQSVSKTLTVLILLGVAVYLLGVLIESKRDK